MEIKKNAQAGTLESSDVLVMVAKSNGGIEIELESEVEEIYGDDIRTLIMAIIKKMEVENISLRVQDKGAFDFIIKSRVQTAIMKACEMDVPDWSKL